MICVVFAQTQDVAAFRLGGWRSNDILEQKADELRCLCLAPAHLVKHSAFFLKKGYLRNGRILSGRVLEILVEIAIDLPGVKSFKILANEQRPQDGSTFAQVAPVLFLQDLGVTIMQSAS